MPTRYEQPVSPRDRWAELTIETVDGLQLAARRFAARTEPHAAVVIAHGFAASKDQPRIARQAATLAMRGYDVVTYDARGHGASEGLCSLGDDEQWDVAAAVAIARQRTSCVVVVGSSMGAIAALRYTARFADVNGVVTVSSPSAWRVPTNPQTLMGAALTRTGLGRRLAARFIDVRVAPEWRHPEPPIMLVRRLSVPIAIIHGQRDRFIPLRDAYELYQVAREPRRLDLVTMMSHALQPAATGPICNAVDWVVEGARAVNTAVVGATV